MEVSRPSSRFGRRRCGADHVLIGLLAVLVRRCLRSGRSAGPGKGYKASSKAPRPARITKLDRALNERGRRQRRLRRHRRVQRRFATASTRITANGGRAGRKLGILKARAGRMPNALLKRLADDPQGQARASRSRSRAAKSRARPRPSARKNVHAAVRLHRRRRRRRGDRLGHHAVARRPRPCANRQGQRVAAFVDFVNNRTHQVRRLGPRHARRRHHRRQRLRLATARAQAIAPEGQHRRAEGARLRRQGPHQQHHRGARLGRREQGAATTSASSTCRSARACSRATTPTR